jgi:hypothetical protein
MITEYEVLESYHKTLKLKRRRMVIENTRSETPQESEERLDAIEKHNNLELRFEAQFVK